MDASQLDALRHSIDLRLDADGRWFHDGEPFTHAGLIALFNRGLDVSPDTGEPIVRIGEQWAYIRCDDVPFVVRSVRVADDQLRLVLNTEAEVLCRPGDLRVGPTGLLYAELGRHRRARFGRAAQASLADDLDEDAEGRVCLSVGPVRVALQALTPLT